MPYTFRMSWPSRPVWLTLAVSFPSVAAAGDPDTLQALRAWEALNHHVECRVLGMTESCPLVKGRDEDADRRAACSGVARALVAQATMGTTVSAMDGDEQRVLPLADRFLENVCEGEEAMVDSLAEQVKHGEMWSVVWYAEATWLVPAARTESCTAWAEVVGTWQSDLANPSHRDALGKVAQCGDEATLQQVFSDVLDTDGQALAYVAVARHQSGKRDQACEAFRRAEELNPSAWVGTVWQTVDRERRRLCGE